MNQKGEAEYIMWFFYIAMSAGIAIMIVTLANSVLDQRSNTYNIEFDLLVDRSIRDLSVTDPITGESRYGIIDQALFSPGKILPFITAEENVAIEATIDGRKIYANKDLFQDGEALAGLQTPYGKELYVLTEQNLPILVKSDEALTPKTLRIRGVFKQ